MSLELIVLQNSVWESVYSRQLTVLSFLTDLQLVRWQNQNLFYPEVGNINFGIPP